MGKKSEKALDIQEQIDRLILKLEKLGFEFMWYNRISGIRRLRPKNPHDTQDYVNGSGGFE